MIAAVMLIGVAETLSGKKRRGPLTGPAYGMRTDSLVSTTTNPSRS